MPISKRAACRVSPANDRNLRVTRLEAALGNTLPSMHLGIVQIEDEAVRRQLARFDGSHTRAELARQRGGAENLASILRAPQSRRFSRRLTGPRGASTGHLRPAWLARRMGWRFAGSP